MRTRTTGLALCIVLLGGLLQADDKPGDAQIKALEDRVRAAEAELKTAKELLAAEHAKNAGAEKEQADAGSLEGVWRIVSINGNRPGGTFVKPPYDEYKIMTAGHYLWLSFDPASGKVLRSGGGTYDLKGEAYTAHVDYSNAKDLRAVVGLGYNGTCRLEGNRWYHYGTMTNGAVFDELWERVH